MRTLYPFAFLLLLTQCTLACNQESGVDDSSRPKDRVQSQKSGKPAAPLIVFRSGDGGQTWQDIGNGLPENLGEDSIRGNSFFASDKGLFFRIGNELYHSRPNATAPFWIKEVFPGEDRSMAADKPGVFYWGIYLKTTNGTGVWSPVFENFQRPGLRSVFETAGGSLFIAIDRGIFRSTDEGASWKHVYDGGLTGNLAASNGVLVSTSMRKIIRSTDNGESWVPTASEDSVAWDIKPIQGGFVAITSASEPGTRRLSTSYDGGKTWKSLHSPLRDKTVIDSIWRTWNDRIHDRLRAQAFMTSIIRVGETFFCTHPEGIFRSSDKGKTWKLLLPSVEGMGFNLFVAGRVIYAIPGKGGC